VNPKIPKVLSLSVVLGFQTHVALGQIVSATDLWDVTQGAVVTGFSGSSKWTTLDTIPNILGANVPVVNPFNGQPWPGEAGMGFFAEDQPIAFVHWMEWTTPSPVTVVGYNLFANSDNNPTYPGARAFSTFRLFSQNPTTHAYDLIDVFSPTTLDYSAVFSRTFGPVTGDRFRAEFVQTASENNGYVQGPRIQELDAIAVPEPTDAAMVIAAALVGGALVSRVRRNSVPVSRAGA
jgi:hypothetical protein